MIRLPAEQSGMRPEEPGKGRTKSPALSLTDWKNSGCFRSVQSADCDTKMILKICAKQINQQNESILSRNLDYRY